MDKLLNFLKKWKKQLLVGFASVFVLMFLINCFGCQGLANANGTGNTVIVQKESMNNA